MDQSGPGEPGLRQGFEPLPRQKRQTAIQLAWLPFAALRPQILGLLQEPAAAGDTGAPLRVCVWPGFQPAHPEPGKLIKTHYCGQHLLTSVSWTWRSENVA